MGKEISVKVKDGTFQAYLATPASGKGGGVVVIQEVFGVNAWVRQITDWLASEGYFALAPDLFWRQEAGVQLDPTKPEQFQKGIDYMMKYNTDMGVEDIQATIDVLRKQPGCNGKVGATGFCMGGLLTYLTATRTDVNVSSSYYGGLIDQKLSEAKNIKTPIIFHLAKSDAFIPEAAQKAIKDCFAGSAKAQVYIYDGTDHGFARSTDPAHYNEAAAKLAHQRTLELFRKNLA